MSIDQFLTRIADREGVDRAEAEEHPRAVLTALDELIGDQFEHIRSQLPAEYAPLLAAPA